MLDQPLPPPAPSLRRTLTGFALGVLGVILLVVLGTWQVERLHWKEGVLRQIDERIHAAPRPPAEIERLARETGDVDYWPVSVTGSFRNEAERYFLSTYQGEPGWNVYVPMDLGGNRFVYVNRGFVPYELKDPARRREGQVTGETTVTGLARNVAAEKPSFLVPANDLKKNQFFWKSLPEMAEGAGLPADATILPFIVDAGEGRAPGGWPVGGTTVIDIPNNHLQYAITWYGLALVLAAMLGYQVLRAWRPGAAKG
ncbi:SURF1-like protein [Aureimonas endophytica]|uniref:SURF1-like protein n=1 Tax=Aureimonas endophytica TaxID=2027858 RepID=A0A916ZV96_9HYPH|nr:SURF1 family protein [Aureimonas endophytica]GGE14343.1 SURF1-like protein [Aureimonas endophytica]